MNWDGIWMGTGVLVFGAVACAAALRLLRNRTGSVDDPGWAIMGGVIAGVLLGPTIFGRLVPDRYESWFLGGVTQRAERDQLARRHDAELAAAMHAGTDRAHLDQLREAYERDLRSTTQRWRDAQWKHQAPLRAFALFAAACVLLYGGSKSVQRGDRRQGVLSPLTIGFWAAALPGGLAYIAMTALWDDEPSQAALTAACLSIGPWMLTTLDRQAADDAELGGARMIQTAGRMASVLAIAAAVWALSSHRGIEGLLMSTCLLALPLGWMVHSRLGSLEPHIRHMFLPALAAAVVVKVELIEDFSFWTLAVILLISDDGRWLGAFCGAMLLGGRRVLRTMRLVVGSTSAAVTQLAVIAVAAHTWAVPRRVVLPVVLGALLIEFTSGTRRKLVQRLTQAEDEFSDRLER